MHFLSNKITGFLFLFLCGTTLFSVPLLRVGILTDTHVTAEKDSCVLLEKALNLFKKQNVDMIVHAGDIADVYDVKAYRNYRDTFNKIYPEKKTAPREIFAYANHDWMGRKKESVWKVFQDVKKNLGSPNKPYDIVKFKGYTFVVVPEFADMKLYKSMLDKAAKENAGKPLFIVDHMPPADTVFGTINLPIERRKLLNNYPSAVLICGHKHNDLRSDLSLWQGEFTVIHSGCLQKWRPFLTGTPWQVFNSDMVQIMDVNRNDLTLRRYSLMTQKEYKAEMPRRIPLPFDRKTAPYAPERLLKSIPAPEFPANTKINISIDEKFAVLSFPHARHESGVYFYKVELFRNSNNKKVRIARSDRHGNFTDTQKKQAKFYINRGYFLSDLKYTVRVTPVNFQGKMGKALEQDFSAPPEKQHIICFESKHPAADCKIFLGAKGSKRLMPDKDGFVNIPKGQSIRLVCPGNIWQGKAGTPYRFTLKMRLKEYSSLQRFMSLLNPDPKDSATGRILLPSEEDELKYVFYHSKREDDYNFYLFLMPGGAGKVRFSYIKSERLNR